MEKSDQPIREGQVREGRITGIKPYGVFVQLSEECKGLIHTTEMHRRERGNMEVFFKVGQDITVRVLKLKNGGTQAVLRTWKKPGQRRRIGARYFETDEGFEPFKKQLPIWVKEYKKTNR